MPLGGLFFNPGREVRNVATHAAVLGHLLGRSQDAEALGGGNRGAQQFNVVVVGRLLPSACCGLMPGAR
jgi:hypothetical protein